MEENAALIAEHLEAAGELHAAYGWHSAPPHGRPTAISAPPGSAGSGPAASPTHYPTDSDPDQLSMRIAPRTMLCVTDGLGSAIAVTRAASRSYGRCAMRLGTRCRWPSA